MSSTNTILHIGHFIARIVMKTMQNCLCKHILLFTFYFVYKKEDLFYGFQSEIAIISITKIILKAGNKTNTVIQKMCLIH